MKWSDRESRELVKDYLDLEGPYDLIEDISKVFNLTGDYVAIQITEDLGWRQHTITCYDVVSKDNLYDYLDELIQCNDCKNGTQLYKDMFCITGANYYEKDSETYKGTDEVRIKFKNFNWEDL
ncbi:MAG: hypothetical protein J6Y02_03965 [Pseudobutyrivibrio sp.]|nr:hypothetical protein [Pseudobutyrivibrio sp.]